MTQPQTVAGKELVGPLDLSDEEYREYEFGPADRRITYVIASPKQLYYRVGGTTHRVVDHKGITHCVPAPIDGGTTVLRWKSSKGVSF